MKKIIPILSFLVVISSCSSMMNSKYVKIEINTNAPAVLITDNDTVETKGDYAIIKLKRQKKQAEIVVHANSNVTILNIPSEKSLTYYANILNLGYGMLVDYGKDKKYTYPSEIYLDLLQPHLNYSIYNEPKKRNLYFRFSIPIANHFRFQTYEEEGNKLLTGFLGIGGGLDYYYKSNRFLSASINFASTFPYAFYNFESKRRGDDYPSVRSAYFMLSNNHRLGAFSFGYGFSYGNKMWDYLYDNPNDDVRAIFRTAGKQDVVGLVFSSYIQNGRYFNFGFIYRPTFLEYRHGNATKKYEHLFSLDLTWKFRLK